MKSVLKMKGVLIFALIVTAPSVVLAQAPDSKTLSSPVADATRAWLQLEAKNLTAAAEEMPADNYSFRPTSQQMTFAHLMAHIGVPNRFMCSGIAGQPAPKDTGVSDKDGKDKLVAEVKASFDYCTSALAKVDDSKLGEEIPSFAARART